MLAYKFDEETKEYKYALNAQVDPKSGGYLLPANSTFIEPSEPQEGYVNCFIDEEWVEVLDHRKQPQINLTTLEISDCDYLGEAHQGYQFITEEVKEDYLADKDKYKVIDGVFTDISDTEEYREIKEQKEKERIGNLKCTKRVFVLMLEELGLDYFEQIEPAIEANRQAKLEWNLCVELERKNPLLEQLGEQFGITPIQLDILFKTANNENSIEDLRATRGA